MSEANESKGRKHNHYFKSVEGLADVDVYRVLLLFGVTDPCIQHAVKKLLVAGGRGAGKDINRDVQEAVDTLQRWQEMRREETQARLPDALPVETLKVDYSTIDIKLNGLQMPTIKEISFCDSPEPATAKSVPIGKTRGSYHAEITFEISPAAWQSFRHHALGCVQLKGDE